MTWPSDPRQRRPRRHQDVFVEDCQGTTPLDDPAFTHRLGYQGQIYEDRHGVYNLTIHTSGSMVGVTHVEGDVTANQAAALKATSVFLAANSSSKLSQRPLSSPICTRHNT